MNSGSSCYFVLFSVFSGIFRVFLHLPHDITTNSSPNLSVYSRHLCGIGKGAKNILDRGAKTMNTMKRVMTTYSRQSSSGSGNQTGNSRSALNSRTRNSQSLNETNQKIINFDEVVSLSNDNISTEGSLRRLHGRKELDSIILNGPVLLRKFLKSFLSREIVFKSNAGPFSTP